MTKEHKIALSALIAFAITILVRNAWLADDAFITLRTVDNFVNGYGLRWNVAERVQSFTSPLWLMALVPPYLITGEPIFSTTILMIVVTLAALIFSLPKKATLAVTTFFFITALSTPTFVFYSVSGLENPLAFLLIGLFLNEYLGENRLARMVLWSSLLALTRHDLALIAILPVLDSMAKNSQKGAWLRAIPAALPFIAWEAFSLIYYGSFVPNTALAKLPIDYPKGVFAGKGFEYLLDMLGREGITGLLIVLGLTTSVALKTKRLYLCAIGIIFYCAYIIVIGGDFMTGRFFGPPMWVALILLAHALNQVGHRITYSLTAASLLLGLTAQHPVMLEDSSSCCGKIDSRGFADEKHFYYGGSGLLNWRKLQPWPNFYGRTPGLDLKIKEKNVLHFHAVGMVGYYSGPKQHIIDIYALGDAFIARLEPLYRNLRAGHYERIVPNGYDESIRQENNLIKNPTLRPLFDATMLVTRGPLFSVDRFKAILDLMLGIYKPTLRKYQRETMTTVPIELISAEKPNGSPWNDKGNIIIPLQGLVIKFNNICKTKTINLNLDHNDTYLIRLSSNLNPKSDHLIYPVPESNGLINHQIQTSKDFDEILIYNIGPDPYSSIGHLITDSSCK